MNVVLNGDVQSEEAICLTPNDRAFQYGDGLFETIRYEQNEVRFWPDHYDRITRGMDAFSLRLPAQFDRDLLLSQILDLLKINNLLHQPARIKLQVWRQPGGLYTPTSSQANFLITARSGSDFAVTEKPVVGVFDAFRLSPSAVSAYKTLNALPYVLAGIAKQKHNADDMILLDTHGHLAECIASNLFWITDNQLFTPALESGCIDGILRRQLLRLAPQHGFSIHQGLFLPDVLARVDAVLCTNVSGIQWIRQIGETTFDKSPQNRLQAVFANL
ncbi:aminotransferase class IV [Larkinella rosea]|uniref:branched-chain-amino-acid transaminase n=1 Tax=Larkinella rosea TaxID=2025312 RepID=A0A3P1BG16_9BACT|nr:aminotransferase class IV [Larkinella rosea]RRB00029.1 aminotransferase IV [Larkinella rosea]